MEKKKENTSCARFFFLPILLLAVEIWLVVVATPPPDVKRPTRAGVFFTRRLSPSLPIGQVATVCVCVCQRGRLYRSLRESVLSLQSSSNFNEFLNASRDSVDSVI